jgi:DNA-binding MarR family transcriptional regulator
MTSPDPVDHILSQWKIARPDLDTTPMAVIGRLSRITAHVTARQKDTFAEYGLDPSGFDVLATLRRTPGQRLTPQQLSASAMISSAATAQRLNRLETDGLIQRRPNTDDGRSVQVELTPQGRDLVDKVLPAHLATEQALLAALTPTETQRLTRLLTKWLAAAADPDDPS